MVDAKGIKGMLNVHGFARRAVAASTGSHYRPGRLIRVDERHDDGWLVRHEQRMRPAGEG
jgi:hypothetical protein